MVRVVTDSTAHLPPQLAEALGITVVPQYVSFGEESFREGTELGVEEFYRRLQAGSHFPKTSQPSVGDFLSVFQQIHADGAEILAILVSSKLSGTLGSAHTAGAMLPQTRISIFDSLSVSLGLGLMVLHAARLAREGLPSQAIVERLEVVRQSSHLVFALDTLEYLRRGGRIGRAAALLGGLLKVKPILEVRDGVLEPLERARSRSQVKDRLVEIVSERNPDSRPLHVGVVHGLVEEEAQELEARLRERFPVLESHLSVVGAAAGAHAGPRALGIAFWAEP